MSNESLTFDGAVRVIRADGQRVEPQPWNTLWCIYWDSAPGERHRTSDLNESGVINYATEILKLQETRRREA